MLALAPDALKADAISLVASHLKEENDFVRYQAMEVLGLLGAQQYVPDLMAFLDSPDSSDRANARRALGRLGQPVD